ncbi:MAG: ABC transporter permease subunit [Alphaproteobacteria bacterium]|nr:ABC transporter permease subunit [Alphaproteobacteria bacterium]
MTPNGGPIWVRIIAGAVLAFLMLPILVIVPLSFNAEPYFTFTPAMLSLDPDGYSLRWYRDIFQNPQWLQAIQNSFIIGISATVIATGLGTLAALGLARSELPARGLIMGLLISPLIVPLVIAATGMFFFYSNLGLTGTTLGLVLAHAALGTPFVVVTVLATLSGFDRSLPRAAASLGADPLTVFTRVTLPVIFPGVASGALFAFITSFDEVVMVLFIGGPEQRTIPRQMWAGLREQISPTILAVATLLIVLSVILLVSIEALRRRSAKLAAAKLNGG